MKKYFLILSFLCIIFILGNIGLILLRNATEFAGSTALIDCTNQVTTTRFQTGKGRDFVLGFTPASNSPSAYQAQIHFLDILTKQTADFDIHGSYYSQLDTSSFLQPHSSYEMMVTFPSNVQPSVIVSLQWIQRGRN